MSDLKKLWIEETHGFHLRWLLARGVLSVFPIHTGSRVRVALMRAVGFKIGHGTLMWGSPTVTGDGDLYKKLEIGEYCWINVGAFFDLGAKVTLEDRVSVAHQVMFMTTSHDIGSADRRAGPLTFKPITIGAGTWVGARVSILPGVTIGPGCLIATGAVVTRDVPPNTIMGGVPAKPIRQMPMDSGERKAVLRDAEHVATQR